MAGGGRGQPVTPVAMFEHAHDQMISWITRRVGDMRHITQCTYKPALGLSHVQTQVRMRGLVMTRSLGVRQAVACVRQARKKNGEGNEEEVWQGCEKVRATHTNKRSGNAWRQ